MPLRILFADDSVTAQNMGKKILTEAGYEVVAVSNGAAAVKKIAEQKPDIIILDVYMPGYSGLEVCEKVRSSIATLKTPVLLTVGKMEPYKQEDANRVRADGVIIKPFEATDLLAIVKKFEERIAAMPPAVAPPPPPRPPVEDIFVPPAETNHEPPPTRTMQPMVEVPDHMATSSAFSELLGTDASHMEHFHVPPAEAAPVTEATASAVAAPDDDVPTSWRAEPEPRPTMVEAAPVEAPVAEESAAAPVAETAAPVPVAEAQPAEPEASVPARHIQIPVYQEPEPAPYEVVPTAAAPSGDVEVQRDPGLQESAEETTRNTVADHREPDLVPMAHHIPAPLAARVNQAAAEQVETLHEELGVIPEIVAAPAGDAHAPAHSEPTHVPAAPPVSEADFEARVAAALAAYGQAPENRGAVAVEAPTPSAVPEIGLPDGQTVSPAAEQAHEPVVDIGEPGPAAEAPLAHAAAAASNHDAIAGTLEAELPAAVHAAAQATGATGEEHDTIAQAVHRVMERMKENLVEEIVRELKSRK